MKKKLLLILATFGFVFGLSAQQLTPDQMISDLTVFKEALEAKHPEMYRYTSKEEYELLFELVKKGMNHEMTVREFYLSMAPLVSALHCGHTKWILAGKDMYYQFYEDNLFPLKLYFDMDQAFVLGHFAGKEVPISAELISINDRPIGEIIDLIKQNSSFGDGFSEGGKYYQLNHYFPALYSTNFGIAEEYVVEIKIDGEIQKLSFSGISLNQIKTDSPENQGDEGPFQFEIKERNVAWLDIDRFFAYPSEPDFKKFLKNSFTQINENPVDDLVIDLRGNEGGNENWGIELYKYIAKEPFRYYERISVKQKQKVDFESKTSTLFKLATLFNKNGKYGKEFTVQKGLKKQKPYKIAYGGRVYLLLDGQSFSVTTEFASRAKSDGRVTIIGSETAGGYAMNTSGFFSIVTLPNSKIDLGIPLLGFHMENLTDVNPMDRGILPDYPVEVTVQDIIGKTDPIMDFSLELIKKPKFIISQPAL
ncbi:S41 family peptidase [Shivajiella indica]|uniref:S41 family peptidase n=1 Tax=Shivajiella indica TaxID=872115 RepID=A0ABW5B602_9BACT